MFPRLKNKYNDIADEDKLEFVYDSFKLYTQNPLRYSIIYLLGAFIALLMAVIGKGMYTNLILIFVATHLSIATMNYFNNLRHFRRRW